MRSELAALDQRFVIATERVTLGDWEVALEKPRSADDLISEADFVKDERLPYWADLWPSAESLGRYLLRTPLTQLHGGAPVVGRAPTALELGSGIGLVTVAALRAGFEVTATDYYDDSLLFAARNAVKNVGREPVTRMVDWRAFPADMGTFDLVLAADVLYERPYAPLVAEAITRTLSRGGLALVADQGRVGLELFLSEASSRGLEHRVLLAEKPRVGPPGDLSAPGPTVTLFALRWRVE